MMTRLTDDARRDRPVAAVTQGPGPDHRHSFAGDHLDLPIILGAALEVTDTPVDAFIARLRQGAIWQDQSLRSADRQMDIQAFLAPEGLRCVIRIAENIWYHHPLGTLHVWGMPLPTIWECEAVPLARFVRHDLLDTLPIIVRSLMHLNARKPELGTCLQLDMPQLRVVQAHDSLPSPNES